MKNLEINHINVRAYADKISRLTQRLDHVVPDFM